MTTIIKVPAVYTCKIPSGEWLNLALVRRVQYEFNDTTDTTVVILTWENGDKHRFAGEDAIAILQAWEEAHQVQERRMKEFA